LQGFIKKIGELKMFKCQKHDLWFSAFENCLFCEKEKFEKNFIWEEQLYFEEEMEIDYQQFILAHPTFLQEPPSMSF
jgi:hypothetical protein